MTTRGVNTRVLLFLCSGGTVLSSSAHTYTAAEAGCSAVDAGAQTVSSLFPHLRLGVDEGTKLSLFPDEQDGDCYHDDPHDKTHSQNGKERKLSSSTDGAQIILCDTREDSSLESVISFTPGQILIGFGTSGRVEDKGMQRVSGFHLE